MDDGKYVKMFIYRGYRTENIEFTKFFDMPKILIRYGNDTKIFGTLTI